jgi:hypothetical protein
MSSRNGKRNGKKNNGEGESRILYIDGTAHYMGTTANAVRAMVARTRSRSGGLEGESFLSEQNWNGSSSNCLVCERQRLWRWYLGATRNKKSRRLWRLRLYSRKETDRCRGDRENHMNADKVNQPPNEKQENFSAITLSDLLWRAGHRPAPSGKRWICANCPPRKTPALSVDDEVYFCHRCHVGGNAVTLKKELGILQDSQWSRADRRAYAQRKELAARKAREFLRDFRDFRHGKAVEFRKVLDEEIKLHKEAQSYLDRELPDELLVAAYEASRKRESLEELLDQIDDRENLSKFTDVFRRGSR